MSYDLEEGHEEPDESRRILLVGLGMWGTTWIDVVRESPYWEVVGYVDVDETRLQEVVEGRAVDRGACYTDVEAAIDATDAEAALCIVPHHAHRDVAVTALERGLHVLTEKPLAGDIEEGTEMIEAANRTGRKLMVSQNYRYKRIPRTVREVLRSGLVDDPGYAFVTFQRNLSGYLVGNYRQHMAHPLLRDMAIHHFDQIRHVLDLDPVSVYARSVDPDWSRFDHDAVAAVTLEMEDGVLVNYTGSWASQGESTAWDGDWRIECEAGEVDWRDNRINVSTEDPVASVYQHGMVERGGEGSPDRGRLEATPIDMPCEARRFSLLEFANAIEADREPETSGRDNLRTFAMVQGAVESAETGASVDVRERYGL